MKAYRVAVDDYEPCITFAKNRRAAKWNAVQGMRRAPLAQAAGVFLCAPVQALRTAWAEPAPHCKSESQSRARKTSASSRPTMNRFHRLNNGKMTVKPPKISLFTPVHIILSYWFPLPTLAALKMWSTAPAGSHARSGATWIEPITTTTDRRPQPLGGCPAQA